MSVIKRLISILLTLILTLSLIPVLVSADKNTDIDILIESLLCAGEYEQGEAIAIVRPESGIASSEAEIAEVSAQAVTEASDTESAESAANEAGHRIMTAQEDTYSVIHIIDYDLTTEELLRQLYADPDVIAAEPNYITMESEDSEAEEYMEMFSADVPFGSGVGDLTPEQWYAADTGYSYNTPLSPGSGYTMNVPGWLEGRTDEDAPANASGTVCIFDSGIDVRNPDIRNVLFEFTPEQQAKYGCGLNGFNASGDDLPAGDITDFSSHGTNCAGVVAAQWNKIGTSGIANGAKIFAVRMYDSGGRSQASSVIEGFQFLINAAKEINLKAVNCSWGTAIPQFIYSVMINELGKKGVNTVFASGNRAVSLDEDIDIGGYLNDVSQINVNASSPDGGKTDFTCWGQNSTDVFAPGVGMLSTITEDISIPYGGYYSYSWFYPEATSSDSLISGIEDFSGDSAAVRFFDSNPVLNKDAQEIGGISNAAGYFDKRSYGVKVKGLISSGSGASFRDTENGSVFLAIPAENFENARYISMKVAMSDWFKPTGVIASFTAKNENGEAVTVDLTGSDMLNKGYRSSASSSIYWSQWSVLSLDISEMINASNELHQNLVDHDDAWINSNLYVTKDGQIDIARKNDPGKVTGLYEWEDSGNKYIITEIGIGITQNGEISDDTTLFIDNVAVGSPDAYCGAFLGQAGTSFAAPAVCGALAVIAKDETPSYMLSDEELETQAIERAARLYANVDYDDALSTLCRTGGRVNFHGSSDFTRKAPLISRAVSKDGVLTVDGYFFGNNGSAFIDDAEVKVLSWEDNKLTLSLENLANGSHVVKVINPDNAVMRAVFSHSVQTSAGRQLYEKELSLPINNEDYAADKVDRIGIDSVIVDGCLYTLSAEGRTNRLSGMWKYDIKKDEWARCSLPGKVDNNTAMGGTLYRYNGQLAFYGEYREPEGNTVSVHCRIWEYDPDKDIWNDTGAELPAGKCILFKNKILIVNIYSAELERYVPFSVFDPETGKTTPLAGEFPENGPSNNDFAVAVTDSKIYFAYDSENGLDEGTYHMIRISYDEENNAVITEEVTDLLIEAVGGDINFWNFSDKAKCMHYSLAGMKDGIAIVGSSVPGNDTHFLRDDSNKLETYDKAACYHTISEPQAAYDNGWLYALGYNAAEPDSMFFRATYLGREEPETEPEPETKKKDDNKPSQSTDKKSSKNPSVVTGEQPGSGIYVCLIAAAIAAGGICIVVLKKHQGKEN